MVVFVFQKQTSKKLFEFEGEEGDDATARENSFASIKTKLSAGLRVVQKTGTR